MMADAPGYEFDDTDNGEAKKEKAYKPKTKEELKTAFLKQFGK